ncbi:(2Fe-2S)-binding protein [Lederbergia wuyishanensis]|uniref:Siderophore-iron reductase FhuF n=1 Tax=Lederbergia wuyishanensis TaxID=1347903 RepID=A0ABU0D4A3_9BACI|nr:IucA/IucC family C-terminal-domain containing protein [Lederbergia wuyishanensis]MCJ8008182.1 (2Fe-2S)-binding protein [Lederbergia wuyishanensis]MDQ0343229.1 siderophore-iron reductase FhuF [Lederbergia wuyishanensis]
MASVLQDNELLLLKKYRYDVKQGNSFCIEKLLDESFLQDFMKNLTLAIGAPTKKAAASIFIKRYAFLAVISLYAMTVWNKKINISLDNVNMEAPERGQNWLPKFSLKNITVQEWDTSEPRIQWRNLVSKELFSNNIYPIISQLGKNAGISNFILWENISVYLFWLYEIELKDYKSENVIDDFHYLIVEASGQLFGDYKENPLQKFYVEKTYLEDQDEELRIRKTCCFSYQTAEGTRCKTCPCTRIAKNGRCYDKASECKVAKSYIEKV